MLINDHVMECCRIYKVKKLVSCLSTCVFPDKTSYPIDETMVRLNFDVQSHEVSLVMQRRHAQKLSMLLLCVSQHHGVVEVKCVAMDIQSSRFLHILHLLDVRRCWRIWAGAACTSHADTKQPDDAGPSFHAFQGANRQRLRLKSHIQRCQPNLPISGLPSASFANAAAISVAGSTQ